MEKDNLLIFTAWLEKQVQHLEYGTITGNIVVKNGKPVLESLNVVRQKRKRYIVGKGGDDSDK